jgi:hypothetical protein
MPTIIPDLISSMTPGTTKYRIVFANIAPAMKNQNTASLILKSLVTYSSLLDNPKLLSCSQLKTLMQKLWDSLTKKLEKH